MMDRKARIAVLVSGGGTNLQAILDAEKSGVLHSGKVTLVISNKRDAFALTRAQNAGVATAVIGKNCFHNQGACIVRQFPVSFNDLPFKGVFSAVRKCNCYVNRVMLRLRRLNCHKF